MASKSASRQKKARHAANNSSDQQSEEGLLLNGSGDDGRSITHLGSRLAIGMLCHHRRLACQLLHFGLGIIGKSTRGGFCPVRKVCGMLFAKCVIQNSYSYQAAISECTASWDSCRQ